MIGGQVSTQIGVPNIPGPFNPDGFNYGDTPFFERPYTVSGTTTNGSGTPLANCNVNLFTTKDDVKQSEIYSDANGNYTIPASQYLTYYATAYLPGSPDVAGTTVNTLKGT